MLTIVRVCYFSTIDFFIEVGLFTRIALYTIVYLTFLSYTDSKALLATAAVGHLAGAPALWIQ